MEPLTPNDPLWKVLGQAKRVEVRPNFTQNIVRMARQSPQDRGWLARLKTWWQEKQEVGTTAWTCAIAAAAVLLTASAVLLTPSVSEDSSAALAAVTIPAPAEKIDSTSTVAAAEADFPLMPGFETEWQNLEQMGDLLAVHDTSLLTDSEINLLLY